MKLIATLPLLTVLFNNSSSSDHNAYNPYTSASESQPTSQVKAGPYLLSNADEGQDSYKTLLDTYMAAREILATGKFAFEMDKSESIVLAQKHIAEVGLVDAITDEYSFERLGITRDEYQNVVNVAIDQNLAEIKETIHTIIEAPDKDASMLRTLQTALLQIDTNAQYSNQIDVVAIDKDWGTGMSEKNFERFNIDKNDYVSALSEILIDLAEEKLDHISTNTDPQENYYNMLELHDHIKQINVFESMKQDASLNSQENGWNALGVSQDYADQLQKNLAARYIGAIINETESNKENMTTQEYSGKLEKIKDIMNDNGLEITSSEFEDNGVNPEKITHMQNIDDLDQKWYVPDFAIDYMR